MVLDTSSTSQSSDPFGDSAPSSDSDPYSDSELSGSLSYQIDRSRLPQPIPIIGALAGYNDQFFSKVFTKKLENAGSTLGRPVTEEEANAFAYWTAKNISIFSYGSPVGLAAGLWRCYTSAGTFRFPFYQPNLETFQPGIFPFQREIPFLSKTYRLTGLLGGIRAVMAWHAVRAFSYGTLGMIWGKMLIGSYAASVVAVGELSDIRLKAFVDAVRAQSRQKVGSLPGVGTQQRPSQGAPKGAGPAGTEDDRGYGPETDDASPTGGIFGEENPVGGLGSGNTDGNTQTQGRPWPPARPAPTQTRTQQTEDQSFDAWDDASPTGGQGIIESTAPQGSAWERLRRGEKQASIPQKSDRKPPPSQSAWSKQQNETQREQREGSTTGDSFAFSKSEEERNYAKEEAQKEFDARVEQERRGGDFSQGSGDQRRW